MERSIEELRCALADAWEDHQVAVEELRALTRDLAVVRAVPRARAEDALGRALAAGRSLRDLHQDCGRHVEVFDLESVPSEEELEGAVTALVGALGELARTLPTRHIRQLKADLGTGRFRHPVARRTARHEARRVAALAEVEELLGATDDPLHVSFPGPADGGSWLKWFWDLAAVDQENVYDLIEAALSELVLVLETGGEHWGWDASGEGVEAPAEKIQSAVSEQAGGAAEHGQEEAEAVVHSEDSDDVDEEVEPRPVAKAKPVSGVPAATRRVLPKLNRKQRRRTGLDEIGALPPMKESTPPAISSVMSSLALEHSPNAEEAAAPAAPVETSDVAETADGETDEPLIEPDGEAPEATPWIEFSTGFWPSRDGGAEAVPWTDEGFGGELVRAFGASLQRWRWSESQLLALGCDALWPDEPSCTWLLDWAAALAAGQARRPEGPAAAWREALERCVADAVLLGDRPRMALAAMLFLVDPNPVEGWPYDEETQESLCTLLELDGPARKLVEEWGRLRRTGNNPAELFLAGDDEAPDADALRAELESKRSALKDKLTRTYSAAGGKVERTHCRDAWDKFVVRAHPQLMKLVDGGGDVSRRDVDKLRKYAKRVFDKGGAKFSDRAKMDRAVDEWMELGSEVLEAEDALAGALREQAESNTGLVVQPEVVAILEEDRTSAGLDAWLLKLARLHLGLEDRRALSLSLSAEQVRSCPLVVEGWGGLSGGVESLDVRRVENPLVAAARWLRCGMDKPAPNATRWLAEHRPDLLLDDAKLSEGVRATVEAGRDRSQERVQVLGGRLRDARLDLAELADNRIELVDAALELVDEGLERDLSLLEVLWLDHCASRFDARVQALVAGLIWQAQQEGYPRAALEQMREAKQYSSLLLARNHKQPAAPVSRLRETLFRREAEKRWKDPTGALQGRARVVDDPEDPQGALIRRWMDAAVTLQQRALPDDEDLGLREAFVEVVLQAERQQRKSKIGWLKPAKSAHYARVDVASLRAWMAPSNPTFLPQLARFSTLSIKCLPAGVSEHRLERAVVREAAEQEISVILAPGLPAGRREDLMARLHARYKAPVAILDDLDLCRLLNVGGMAPEPLAAMMELVAERQPWERFCPYEVVEGQHVRMEMFVGREDQAEKLAHQATFSRIFSGRRLGKTALLKYLQESSRYDELPSGNKLHVLFCSIAGDQHEDAVASKVLRGLANEFELEPPEVEDTEAMKRMLEELVEARPEASLLILLDEADTFFEEQVTSDASSKQQSLSWWMSRHAEKNQDSAGIPRVRFVLCGYLHTDQNRGVWENKGDVLRLKPLRPEAAVELIAKPLAKIGIDVAREADGIAFRCGYQPAVLIRFGLELLEHLKRTRSRQEQERVEIKPQDVIDVFMSNPVQRAIYEACWLNFVGHAAGGLVFAALLMELRDRTPAAAVEDVAESLLGRIRSVVPSFRPGDVYPGKWSDFVAQQLRELVDRSLLIQVGHRPAAYRLRFPHHLPVLVVPDPAQRVREVLELLKDGGAVRSPEWLLSDAVLSELAYAVSDEAVEEFGVDGAVVLTQWPEPLVDRQNGLPFKTGAEVSQAFELPDSVHREILVGGLGLGREALMTDTLELEIPQTGRLSVEQLQGWFQRRRATQFTSKDAWSAIMERTGGVPLLVRELDQLVHGLPDDAPTIGSAQLDGLLAKLEERIEGVWRRLLSGSGPSCLTDREVQIIALVREASKAFPDAPGLVIEEGEVSLAEGVAPFSPQDWSTLRLLLDLGLLPRAGSPSPEVKAQALSELAEVGDQDPIVGLLRHLP